MTFKEFKKTIKGYNPEDIEIHIRTYDEQGEPIDLPAKLTDLVTDIQFDESVCIVKLEADFDFYSDIYDKKL